MLDGIVTLKENEIALAVMSRNSISVLIIGTISPCKIVLSAIELF